MKRAPERFLAESRGPNANPPRVTEVRMTMSMESHATPGHKRPVAGTADANNPHTDTCYAERVS